MSVMLATLQVWLLPFYPERYLLLCYWVTCNFAAKSRHVIIMLYSPGQSKENHNKPHEQSLLVWNQTQASKQKVSKSLPYQSCCQVWHMKV